MYPNQFTPEQILTMLAEGPSRIAEVTSSLTPEQLRTNPHAGEWSARDVLAHMRSCADVWGGCIARILHEDRPAFKAVNPTTWIKSTDYFELEFSPSLQAFTEQRADRERGGEAKRAHRALLRAVARPPRAPPRPPDSNYRPGNSTLTSRFTFHASLFTPKELLSFMRLSHSAAQALMLAAQGLDRCRVASPTKEDVLATIRRMEVLQIDTISVVARSPYLVLWSRLGDYRPEWLDELLAAGKLFEYWSHAASILPIEDYPLYRRHMLDHHYRFFHSAPRWIAAHAEAVEHVRSFAREHGELRASDFERTDGQKSGWFNWKEEKIALEALLATGELMVARRHNFQRVYALREQVLQRAMPGWDDSQAPTMDEVKRVLTLKAVRALGVTHADWVPDYFRTPAAGTAKLLKGLAESSELITVEVDGWQKPGFVHPDNAALLEAASGDNLPLTLTTFLSPFDPLVWDRRRATTMFNFDYRIECYTPEAKRRYGYFTLPILRRGSLIGRLDAKAHRKEGLFEVKTLHLEPDLHPDAALIEDVAGALLECARWHRTPEVVVRRSDPPNMAPSLESATKSLAA